jgi:gamma-glutamyltranspeptidase/glutathione hydrolase
VRRTALSASEGFLHDAVSEVRGNAVDLVVAAVLAAAAQNPSVLLGPVQLLVGGAGVGENAVDGRVRQPGKGAERPRGFTGEPPRTARVGAPLLPAALFAALATFGTATQAAVMGAATAIARELSPERARLLERLGRLGPRAFLEFSEPLLAATGKMTGGLLTAEDLVLVPTIEPCTRDPKTTLAFAPWSDEEAFARTEIVAAIDGRGTVAIAAYEVNDLGVPIPELGLLGPAYAAPVRRGERRVPPGVPCGSPAAMALVGENGVIQGAVGFTQGRLRDVRATMARTPSALEPSLRAELGLIGKGAAVATLQVGKAEPQSWVLRSTT